MSFNNSIVNAQIHHMQHSDLEFKKTKQNKPKIMSRKYVFMQYTVTKSVSFSIIIHDIAFSLCMLIIFFLAIYQICASFFRYPFSLIEKH